MAKITTTLEGDLAIIPLQAMAPFRESLEWKTDISTSFNGTEERLALRRRPRQYLDTDYQAQYEKMQDAFNTAYGALGLKWAVPYWPHATNVGTLEIGITSLYLAPDSEDYRDPGFIFFWNEFGDWHLSEIASIDYGPLQEVFFEALPIRIRNAWCMPCRIGRASSPIQKTARGHNAAFGIMFDIDDQIDFEPAAPTQYAGEDLYLTENLFTNSKSSSEKITTNLLNVDSSIGRVYESTPWLFNRVSLPYRKITETKEEAKELILFLHRRMGKFRAFYYPSFQNDIKLTSTGFVDGNFYVSEDSIYEYALGRTHIAVNINGVWYPHTILSVGAPSGGECFVTIASSLFTDASNIKCISWMGLKRLDTDKINLNWIGGGVCETSMQIIEVSP